jgi:preprotein translocase subunit SecD
MRGWPFLLILLIISCDSKKSATFTILDGKSPLLQTSDLECALISEDVLKLKLNAKGSETFSDYTGSNIGDSLQLSLCESVSAPIVIQARIAGGELAYILKDQSDKECAKLLEKQIGICK